MQSFLLYTVNGVERCLNLDTVHQFLPGEEANTTEIQFKDVSLADVKIPYPFTSVVRHLNQVTRLPRA